MNRGINVKTIAAAAAVALTVACGSQPAPQQAAPPPAPKVATPAERAAWYQACWKLFNDKSWDAFKACYADSAESEQIDSGQPVARGADAVIASAKEFTTAFPDVKGTGELVFVHGDDVIGVYTLNGTHTGPLAGPGGKSIPATNKKVGYVMAHGIQTDATGAKVVKEYIYADNGTVMAQLGLSPAPARPVKDGGPAAPMVIVSSGADLESKNVAAFRGGVDAFNKHDTKGVADYNAPDAVYHDMTQPKDMDGKGNEAMLKEFIKAFPDCHLTINSLWGAGDYVVARGVFEGTNTGNSPSMGIRKPTGKAARMQFIEFTRYDGGKIKEDWLFFDGMAFATQLGLAGN